MSHRILLLPLLAFTLLSSCAYQGVVVEKHSRPLPFPASLGLDGMFSFQLRDRAGELHSQMVTDYVFASYRVGDYFDDLQPPPAQTGKGFHPQFRATPDVLEPQILQGPDQIRTRKPTDRPYHPVRTTSVRRSHKSRNSTAKSSNVKHGRHRANVAAATHRKRQRPNNA
jgi:hypothetical protein